MLPSIRSKVASELGVSTSVLDRICFGAPYRYKVFRVRKRGGGERTLAQPAREVKAVQRALVRILQESFPIHEAASAYKPGASIRRNALHHAGSKYILKLDFREFFPSILEKDIVRLLSGMAMGESNEKEHALISRALSWKGERTDGQRCLCIGAPSSPFLSNAILFPADHAVADGCKEIGVSYTRYSDDITLGSQSVNALRTAEELLIHTIASLDFPRLELNNKKRLLIGRASRIQVVGVTLTTQGSVSVGRVRKRGIRAGFFSWLYGKLDPESISRLRGEVAFALGVEPEMRALMAEWYGEDAVQALLRGDPPPDYRGGCG